MAPLTNDDPIFTVVVKLGEVAEKLGTLTATAVGLQNQLDRINGEFRLMTEALERRRREDAEQIRAYNLGNVKALDAQNDAIEKLDQDIISHKTDDSANFAEVKAEVRKGQHMVLYTVSGAAAVLGLLGWLLMYLK